MKCPNCNAEIPEGKLYCEECGAELQIVPDIDIDLDIETEMQNTMSSIVENEFYDDDDYEDEDDIDFDDDPNLLSFLLSGRAGGKVFYAIFIILIIAAGIGAIIFARQISDRKTLDYQLEKAEENIQNNNLLGAIEYLEQAYSIEKDPAYLFKIADYYYTLGRENDAIYTLSDIATGEFPTANREEAYNKIFTLYENSGNIDKISAMLESCDVESVLNNYSEYIIVNPEFNYEAGTYQETIIVKLSAPKEGKIHYTTDGTQATINSPVYDSPLFLEFGSYTVSAVFENKAGQVGDTITKKYLIDVDFVFEPTINTDSGEYSEATVIEADVPVNYNLFYTTDGTDPDRSSTKYTGPIQMPFGHSTYKFISYATDGTQSTIIERDYYLTFNSGVTEASAVLALQMRLVEKGINEDLAGHRPGVDGNFVYIFTTAYPVEGNGDAFFVVEYFVNSNGVTTRTGTVFGIDVYNENNIYIVQPKGNGYMRVEF